MEKSQLKIKAKKIKLLLLDVDGVLTDGSIIYDEQGRELKIFNVRDGAMVKWLKRAGIEVAILSGRKSKAVEKRAKELGVELVIQDAKDKLPAFQSLLKQTGLKPEEIAYLGDDWHDLVVLKRVGLSACPKDAVKEIKTRVDYVCKAKGGKGAVRELGEIILKAQGKWKEIVKKYLK